MSINQPRGRVRVVRPRRRPEFVTALAEIDRRLLGVLCAHRVVTQEQLCRLFPAVPERTLRYRTRRLHDLGLAGRSRPYREQGSAPNHHWPTRRADCLVRGEPMPKGGERREPNPLFLAHAAALTDLYVVLATEAHTIDLELRTFRREEDAREPFNDGARDRSLAPDALIVLDDTTGRRLWAFVEIDLGTMSHARLRQKAAVYLAYAKAGAWRSRRPYMPALLFLTTSTSRAYRFLKNLAGMLDNTNKYNPSPYGLLAVAGAVAVALDARSLLGDPCLADIHGNSRLLLLDVLNDARAPYERAQAAQRKQEEAEEAELRELLADPEALREHLRKHQGSLDGYLAALGPSGEGTIDLLLAGTESPDPDERAALNSIGRDLGTKLVATWPSGLPEPSSTILCDIELLADHYRRSQERRLAELACRYGTGPSLRKAQAILRSGVLIEHAIFVALPSEAERDTAGRAGQQECRLAYEEWREHAAGQLARKAGPLGRLTHPREQFYPQLDRERLKVCATCGETIYPGSRKPDDHLYNAPITCHYCTEPHGTRPYDSHQNASKEARRNH